jgi:hypothetical protein
MRKDLALTMREVTLAVGRATDEAEQLNPCAKEQDHERCKRYID